MQVKVIQPTMQPKTYKLRVCAYARVSVDSEELENSLDNQISYFTSYIKANPSWEFCGVYADFGISGFYEKRPQFQQMIADARAGKIDLIIVKSVSRFARNTETVLKFSRELKSIGVGILFQLQNINTLDGSGELMLAILAAFAQAESEDASQNAHLTYKRKFNAGERTSGLEHTYGYQAIDGEVAIDEEVAPTVRLIFDLAAQKVWPGKIAIYLNKQGIPSPGGQKWIPSTVFRILDNTAYKGDLMLQKTYLDSRRVRHRNRGEHEYWYIPGYHPAIVSNEQWDAVQEILMDRSKSLEERKATPKVNHSPRSTYPLSGKLFCPYCGEKLIHKWGNKNKDEYWACKMNLKVGSHACKGVWLPASVADEWGEISEPVTVLAGKDKYGMREYTAYPKEEYEQSADCPYREKGA